MVEETKGPLDKLGSSRETLKAILGFGAVVAEVSSLLLFFSSTSEHVSFEQLHPIAKLVIGICIRAWEVRVLDYTLATRSDGLCSTSRRYRNSMKTYGD